MEKTVTNERAEVEAAQRERIQYEKMVKTPIPRLIVSLGIPTMLNMMVTSLYNMADTLFVSGLGEQATGAVSVVLSLMSIIQALGFTLGMGAGAIVSSLLGKRQQKEADEVFSTAFFSALAVGVLLMTFGLIFLEPLMRLLGAAEEVGVAVTTLEYAKIYTTYILIAAPFMCMSYVLNNVLRAQGKALLSMLGLVTGAVLNVALDPLFIYVFHMGIAGAAIATAVSQFISFCILIFLFVSGKTITRIRIRSVARRFSVYGKILSTGFPSFCRQILASLCTVLLNRTIVSLGIDGGQAAFGVVQKVFMLAFSVSLGIGQGYQPVLGYNYSAKRYDRVRSAYLFTLGFSSVLMLAFAVLCASCSGALMNAFLDSAQAKEVGQKTLLFQCLAMPLLPVNFMAGVTYQVVGNKLSAALLSCSRQGLFYIPFVFILPSAFGILGLECLQAASDLGAFLFALPFTFLFFKELKRLEAEEGVRESE
ncbi:MAG: MATE family efflux transporter [Clostridia bacterium]|nr:MATE family efflux transporter [Clostridia bacterium]